jgi:hypothetical protein
MIMKAVVFASVLALALAAGNVAQAAQKKPATGQLSAEEAAHLTFMREEEKLARDLYLSLNESWNRMVFANIADSEDTHFATLGDALSRYRLADPALPQAGRFGNPDLQALYDHLLGQGRISLATALWVGGLVEEVDIQDLERALAATSHSDLKTAYSHLQCGSRNHLRAFARNLAMLNVTYRAQVLPQDQVDAILASDQERCGW